MRCNAFSAATFNSAIVLAVLCECLGIAPTPPLDRLAAVVILSKDEVVTEGVVLLVEEFAIEFWEEMDRDE